MFHQHSDICSRVRQMLSDDASTPAGKWKAKHPFDPDQTWYGMKSKLLSAFAREESYRLEEQMAFVKSLQKKKSESYSSFLYRVQWVLQEVVQASYDSKVTRLLYLLGL